MPIVLDQRVVDTVGFVWLGGGEPDVKLALSVDEFVLVFDPIVAPVSAEITAGDSGANDGT